MSDDGDTSRSTSATSAGRERSEPAAAPEEYKCFIGGISWHMDDRQLKDSEPPSSSLRCSILPSHAGVDAKQTERNRAVSTTNNKGSQSAKLQSTTIHVIVFEALPSLSLHICCFVLQGNHGPWKPHSYLPLLASQADLQFYPHLPLTQISAQ